MSSYNKETRVTVPEIRAKKGGEPIVSLTAYSSFGARIADPCCDFLLVGDSVGTVVYGFETTLPVTIDMMILHGQAVMRGSKHALVVVDMPFGSYEKSPEHAFSNASRILAETGCGAVKIGGGAEMAKTVRFLSRRGIPVMGHVGLMEQSVRNLGGFKIQGCHQSDWPRIESDASAIAEAGAFSIVVEGVVEPLAAKLTRDLFIPTIGIGASNQCDGQLLVTEDMLGFGEIVPKFVRRYSNLEEQMAEAINHYANDVKTRLFPGENETYSKPDE